MYVDGVRNSHKKVTGNPVCPAIYLRKCWEFVVEEMLMEGKLVCVLVCTKCGSGNGQHSIILAACPVCAVVL